MESPERSARDRREGWGPQCAVHEQIQEERTKERDSLAALEKVVGAAANDISWIKRFWWFLLLSPGAVVAVSIWWAPKLELVDRRLNAHDAELARIGETVKSLQFRADQNLDRIRSLEERPDHVP